MHEGYEASLTDEQLVAFMQNAVGMLGADEWLTPREVIRDFMDLLHTLREHPETTFEQLLSSQPPAQRMVEDDLFTRTAENLYGNESGAKGIGERRTRHEGEKEHSEHDDVDDFLAEFEL